MKRSSIISGILSLSICLFSTHLLTAQSRTGELISQYNIVWETQSTSSVHSMPVGGSNLGLNAWVEEGDLLFYIGSPDAHDETGNNIKLGRIRITTTPSVFQKDYRQELVLYDGYIHFHSSLDDGSKVEARLWVDVKKPVIHIEFDCKSSVDFEVSFETWPADAPLYHAVYTEHGLEWTYRLDQSLYNRERNSTIERCGMKGLEDRVIDPGRNLILGGRISGLGLIPAGQTDGKYMATSYTSWSVKTKDPVKKLDLIIPVRMAQDASLKQWQSGIDELQNLALNKTGSDFELNKSWWHDFWDRSYISVQTAGNFSDRKRDSVWMAGRNYQLFRYILACNSKGKYPTLFNGGFLNVDTPVPDERLKNQSPDERLWSRTGFMAQNQRLVYWPMIKAGDEDLISA